MSEMVERVARLLWREFATEGTYDEDRHGDREGYLAAARAAIAAMREPDVKMIDAFSDHCLSVGATDSPLAKSAWEAMIDAALKEDR